MLKQYLRRLDGLSEDKLVDVRNFRYYRSRNNRVARYFCQTLTDSRTIWKSWCLTFYCYFIQKVNGFANNLFDDFCWYLYDILPFLSDFWHLTKLDVYQTVDQSLKNLNLGHIWLPVKDASLNSHNSAAKYCLRCWENTDSSGHY